MGNGTADVSRVATLAPRTCKVWMGPSVPAGHNDDLVMTAWESFHSGESVRLGRVAFSEGDLSSMP